jgi:excisionase family DNA binding protein
MDPLLTVGEVEQVLRRSRWFVLGEIASGRLKHARVGGLIRVTPGQLAEYLEECADRGDEKVRARKARRAQTTNAREEVVHA